MSVIDGFHSGPLSWSIWNLQCWFVEGGKPEDLEKNPRRKDENQQQTRLAYDTEPELNPGHIGGRWALSPLHHPWSPTPQQKDVLGYHLV